MAPSPDSNLDIYLEQSPAEFVLAMTPEALYDLTMDQRRLFMQKLTQQWEGSDLRKARQRLRFRNDIDTFLSNISVLAEYPANSNPYENDDAQIEKHREYENDLQGMMSNFASLISQEIKHFSEEEFLGLSGAFHQSITYNQIYSGDIDNTTRRILTHILSETSPVKNALSQICLWMTHNFISDYDSENSFYPTGIFGQYCLWKIDFSTFQLQLRVFINSQKESLAEIRSTIIRAALRVSRIIKSGQVYSEEPDDNYSPINAEPLDVILKKHNEIVFLDNILALDEETLQSELQPLVHLYKWTNETV